MNSSGHRDSSEETDSQQGETAFRRLPGRLSRIKVRPIRTAAGPTCKRALTKITRVYATTLSSRKLGLAVLAVSDTADSGWWPRNGSSRLLRLRGNFTGGGVGRNSRGRRRAFFARQGEAVTGEQRASSRPRRPPTRPKHRVEDDQLGGNPSANSSRRSRACSRICRATAYSGEVYHSRSCSEVGNSTMTRRR